MSNRSVLDHATCIAFALALPVAVMTSPIRPSRSAGGSVRTPYLRRNFALPPTHSTRLSATLIASPPDRVKTLSSGNEEEQSRTARPAYDSLELPPPPSLSPARDLTWVPIRATRPLRC